MSRKHLLIRYLLSILTPRSIFYNINGPDEISTSIAVNLPEGSVYHIHKDIDNIKSLAIPNIIATDTTDLELIQDYHVEDHPKPLILLNQSCLLKPFAKGITDTLSPCKVLVPCTFNSTFLKNVQKLLDMDFKIVDVLRNKPIANVKYTEKFSHRGIDSLYLYRDYEDALETLTRIDVGLVQYLLFIRC